MALPWIAALKLVPWTDVIEATPRLVQGARRLLGESGSPSEPEPHAAAKGEDALETLQARVTLLEMERRDAAVLLHSLTEQNLQVVQQVQRLLRRQRLLAWLAAVLSVGCVMLFFDTAG